MPVDHYCTIADVNSYVPQSPFTSTTTPSQAQVQGYITQVANQLDLTLVNIGYVTPVVTGTLALAELRKANAWGALGLAQQSRITAIAPDQAVGLSVWTKMLNDWIKALSDPKNPYELTGADRNGNAVVKPLGAFADSPMQQSVDSGTANDPVRYITNPTFSMDMKF